MTGHVEVVLWRYCIRESRSCGVLCTSASENARLGWAILLVLVLALPQDKQAVRDTVRITLMQHLTDLGRCQHDAVWGAVADGAGAACCWPPSSASYTATCVSKVWHLAKLPS